MRNIPIVQMDLDGKDIAVFKSASEAERKLGLQHGYISLCCRGLADRVKQYRFRYANDELNRRAEDVRQARKSKVSKNHKEAWAKKRNAIYQYALDGTFMERYKNADVASEKSGVPKPNILACCRGVTKNCGGFIWSYNSTAASILENDIPVETDEEWRDVVGLEGLYMVSSHGRVWSVRRRRESSGSMTGGFMLSNYIDRRNRITSSLTLKGGKHKTAVTARLVAEAFIPNPYNLPQVNHKDENPLNNHVNNLEWCTAKYNCNYGTRTQRIVEKQRMEVLQYTLRGEFVKGHPSINEAARALKVDAGHISDVCNGKRRWAYGFFWRYADDALYEDARKKIIEKIRLSKEKRKANMSKSLGKRVRQYTLEGDFVKEYISSRYASDETGIKRPYISMAATGKKDSAGGFIWKYVE